MPTRAGDPRNTKTYRTARAQLKAEQRPRCEMPGCKHPTRPIDYTAPPNAALAFNADHIIPLALGGAVDHLRATHRACNTSAGAKLGGQIVAARRRRQTQRLGASGRSY